MTGIDIESIPVAVETVLTPEWGSGDGQLAHNPEYPDMPEMAGPSVFCVDSMGRIYIDDYFNHRVVLFSEDGQQLNTYPYPPGTYEGEKSPRAMVASSQLRSERPRETTATASPNTAATKYAASPISRSTNTDTAIAAF